ncbi:MAG: DUF5667 domain-containing protein [Nocardioidaceae bacterium]
MSFTGRRADEFAQAVDGGGSCADVSAETRALVQLAEQLRSVETPEPRADFAHRVRTQLMEAAPAELAPTSPGPGSHRSAGKPSIVPGLGARRRRGLSAVAVACIVVGAGAGVAAASQSALPGETLYPVKRGIERIEVSTAGSTADRGAELLDHATRRLDEAHDLSVSHPDRPDTSALVKQALRDFATEARDGADALGRAYRHDSSNPGVSTLRAFASTSMAKLGGLGGSMPSGLRSQVRQTARLLTTLDAHARTLCPACSDREPLHLTSSLMHLQSVTQDISDARGASPTPPAADNHRHSASSPVRRSRDRSHPTRNLLPPVAPTQPQVNQPESAAGPQGTAQPQHRHPTRASPTQPQQPEANRTPSLPPPEVEGPSVQVKGPSIHVNGPSANVDAPDNGLDLPTVHLNKPLDVLPQVLDDTSDLLQPPADR